MPVPFDHESTTAGAGHPGGDFVPSAGGKRTRPAEDFELATDCAGGGLGEAADQIRRTEIVTATCFATFGPGPLKCGA